MRLVARELEPQDSSANLEEDVPVLEITHAAGIVPLRTTELEENQVLAHVITGPDLADASWGLVWPGLQLVDLSARAITNHSRLCKHVLRESEKET